VTVVKPLLAAGLATGAGIGAGFLIGEVLTPLFYRGLGMLPGKWGKRVGRIVPHHHEIGQTVAITGLVARNPSIMGVGLGLALHDGADLFGRKSRYADLAERAGLTNIPPYLEGVPELSIKKYDIPEWFPDHLKYSIIGNVFKELVNKDTWAESRHEWVPPGREHPLVLAIGRKIMREYGLDGHNQVGVLSAIQDWIQRNINYSYDPRYFDTFFHPWVTLATGTADCDDSTLLAVSLGEALGIRMMAKLVAQHPQWPTRFNHVYGVGIIRGKEYPIETIVPVPFGYEPPHIASRLIKFD